MDKVFNAVLWILLFLFVLAIGSVVIGEGSDIVADLAKYIMNLFERAHFWPSSGKGFACFVQLVAIAIFVGWTINRFKKR